jgi:hypothetical protein
MDHGGPLLVIIFLTPLGAVIAYKIMVGVAKLPNLERTLVPMAVGAPETSTRFYRMKRFRAVRLMNALHLVGRKWRQCNECRGGHYE